MSLHVYIANEGFKDNPIAAEAWIAAARQHHGLCVVECGRRNGGVHHRVHLKENHASSLELSRTGLVHAQAPSRDLIVVMFDLAAALGARVYSENLKPYRSPDDWEKRTREFRKTYAANKARHRRSFWLWAVFFAVVVAAFIYSVAMLILQRS